MELAMRALKHLLFASIFLAVGTISGMAADRISAVEAYDMATRGDILLVDVRRPSEWRESGVAAPANTISMHQRGFLEKLSRLQAEHPGKPVALICATGGRTAFLQEEFAKRGLGPVIDVSEGMFGNGRAPGWLKRGLPIKQLTN